jgi:hypothetical protein
MMIQALGAFVFCRTFGFFFLQTLYKLVIKLKLLSFFASFRVLMVFSFVTARSLLVGFEGLNGEVVSLLHLMPPSVKKERVKSMKYGLEQLDYKLK